MVEFYNRFRGILRNSFFIVLSLFLTPSAWAATINVEVDRNVIEEGESINVQFSSEQGIDGDPDFSPLEKDFRVLRPNRSYSMSFINGKLSRSTSWSLILIPKMMGVFQIPAIKFGKDTSRAVRITVNPASRTGTDGSDELFILEADVDKTSAFIQSQIIYSVKIYHAVGLVNASLSDFNLDDSDAIVEKLGDDLSYDKKLNGRFYKVFEKRFAIYPQKSGKLSIDPVVFEGQYASTKQPLRRTWPGMSLPQTTQIKRLKSKKIEVNVKPIPNDYKGAWVPAKEFILAEDWPEGSDKFVVGEPVTRKLTLIAEGVLSTQIPELNKEPIENIKQYSDQPVMENKSSTEGIIGMRQELIALIPTVAGQYTLPAIEVSWWNVEKGKREVARIKERIISVVEAPNTMKNMVPKDVISELPDIEKSPIGVTEDGSLLDISANKFNRYLLLISVSLLIGWILTILAWRRTYKKHTKNNESLLDNNALEIKNIKGKITSACKSNNKALSKQLLIQWGRHAFPEDSPNSLGRLSMFCDEPLKSQLTLLNSALYGTRPTENWDGELLLKAFLECYNTKNKKSTNTQPVIKPLHYKVAS